MSGVVVDPMGVKVDVKFGDCRSNCSLDIRLPHFVMNNNDGPYENRAKDRYAAFCLKTVRDRPYVSIGS